MDAGVVDRCEAQAYAGRRRFGVDVFDGSATSRRAIARSGSSIVISDVGSGVLKPCPGPTGNATVFNTDQIIVHGNASATFDSFSVHTLTPGKTPESDGTSELETVINNAAPTSLTCSAPSVPTPCESRRAAA